MHHGETRGKRKTQKVCKKHVNVTKSEGKFAKVGGKIPKIGRGNVGLLKQRK